MHSNTLESRYMLTSLSLVNLTPLLSTVSDKVLSESHIKRTNMVRKGHSYFQISLYSFLFLMISLFYGQLHGGCISTIKDELHVNLLLSINDYSFRMREDT